MYLKMKQMLSMKFCSPEFLGETESIESINYDESAVPGEGPSHPGLNCQV